MTFDFLNSFYELFAKWIRTINPKDLGNDPSDLPGCHLEYLSMSAHCCTLTMSLSPGLQNAVLLLRTVH